VLSSIVCTDLAERRVRGYHPNSLQYAVAMHDVSCLHPSSVHPTTISYTPTILHITDIFHQTVDCPGSSLPTPH
jgi:hypothetical protein